MYRDYRFDRDTTWVQARLKALVKRVEEVYELARLDPEGRGTPPRSYFFDDDLLEDFFKQRIENLKQKNKPPPDERISQITGIGDARQY